MHANLDQFANDAAAVPVLALMRDGRWRKARDAAKDLCKRDRPRYLMLLVEANVGLARDLIGRGLTKDAATVVAYLESVAPPATVAALRAALANPAPSAPAENAGGTLAWAALLGNGRALAEGRPAGEVDFAELDRLVTSGFEPAAPADDAVARQLAGELSAVRAACAATGDGRWEDAQTALRGVSARSVFRHWRMFLRGVRCVLLNEPETARQCFAGLPPQGALARAARAFAPKLAPSGPAAPTLSRVALFLAMTGQPDKWASPLASAAAQWQSGKRVQAFLDLLAAMKAAFPATVPGLPAMLTDAMLPFCERMDDSDEDDAERMMPKWRAFDPPQLRSHPDASLAAMRAVCLTETATMSPGSIETLWRSHIELWHTCYGPDPVRDAMLWRRLADDLIQWAAPDGSYEGFGRPGRDCARARAAIEKAVECDPDNEEAWMSLLALADLQKDHKALNKLLDDLSQRFPENKEILLRTGTRAVERKAFGKGLTALRKALVLDPLDRNTRHGVATALILQIRDYRRKGRPQTPLWEDLEPLLDDRPALGHLGLCRWLARLWRTLLDDDREAAAKALAEAVELAPSDAERLFAERLLAGMLRQSPRPAWAGEWSALKHSGNPSWAALKGCLEIGLAFHQLKDWRDADSRASDRFVLDLCKAVAKSGMKHDPDGLLALLDRVDFLYNPREPWAGCGLVPCLDHLESVLARTVGRKPGADVRLRLALRTIDEFKRRDVSIPSPALFNALDEIESEGEAKSLPGVVSRVRALRDRWRRIYEERMGDPWDGDDDFDEDDDFDDDEDEDEEVANTFTNLLRLLQASVERGDRMSERVAVLCLLQFGLSQEEIDLRIARFRAASPPPPRRKAKRPLFPDPNQPDLPF